MEKYRTKESIVKDKGLKEWGKEQILKAKTLCAQNIDKKQTYYYHEKVMEDKSPNSAAAQVKKFKKKKIN